MTEQALQIIDADAHVNPPHDMWEDYLPEALRHLAPKIEHGEDADYILFEGNRRKINLINAQGGRKGKDFKMEGRVSDARAGGWMPAARLEDMDKDGIHSAVLFGGGPLGTTNNAAAIKTANNNTRAMQRPTQAGVPISASVASAPARLRLFRATHHPLLSLPPTTLRPSRCQPNRPPATHQLPRRRTLFYTAARASFRDPA